MPLEMLSEILNEAVSFYYHLQTLQLVFKTRDGNTYGVKCNDIRARRCDIQFCQHFEKWYFETELEEIPGIA